MKCSEQKKGCVWGSLKPGPLANEGIDTPPPASSIRVSTRSKPPPPVAGPSAPKGTKRKQPGDDASPDRVASSPFPPNRAEVIIYTGPPRRSSSRSQAIVVDSRPASPDFSMVDLPQFPSTSTSSVGPAPSIVATSSSSTYSSSALALEVALLTTRLAAANDRLVRERELHRQEVESLKEQFDREQASYQEYIDRLHKGEQ